MRAWWLAVSALMPALWTALPAGAQELADPYDLMPEGEGKAEVGAYCAACHSLRLVIQQGQTREGWEYLLHWMEDEQGMTAIEEPDRTLVLDYLSKFYGTDRADAR